MTEHRRTTRLGFAFVLGMIAATAFVPPAAARTDSPRAVGISSISPAVADRGGIVSIAGNGFGGPNVQITVGGVPAELLGATGSTARFRVPALAGPGRVTVRATNPGRRVGEIDLQVRFDGVSTPVLDAPRRVSATVGRAGGSLGSGGVTLTVPAGALSEDTTIALTPLVDVAHSPLAGSIVGGVKLEPEGLLFLAPAALTMALPPGVAPSEVLGFGSAGDGSELHLQPHSLTGGTITLRLWHFSTAGAAAGGATAAAAMQTHQPSAAEQQALQRIAAAQHACQAELAAGVPAGPACTNVHPEGVRALFDWYTNAVRPGLEAAGNAPSFVAEVSLADWLAWEAEVREIFENSAPPACGTLQNECEAAHALATTAVAAHADRRLDNCTGTALRAQLRDVLRMADFAGAGAIDLTTATPPLPDANNGDLMSDCAHLKIEVTHFPRVAALLHANTLRGRVTVDVHTGPDRTDVPFTLSVDGALVAAAGDGSFTTTLTPATAGSPVDVELEAEAVDPNLQITSFSATEDVEAPTRARLLLIAQGPTTVPAGGTLDLRVLVAGDGMTDAVTLAVGGPGSVGPTPVTPDEEGEATAVYTAPNSADNPNTHVIATLLDGTSATVPITIDAVVTVSVDPTSATLAAGGTRNFTATVAGSLLGVTWSATGGSIVATGGTSARYTAGSTAGTFSVTATSIANPSKTARATVTIARAAAGTVRVLSRSSGSEASCSGFAFACLGDSDHFPGTLGPFEADADAAGQSAPNPDFPDYAESGSAHATLSSDVDALPPFPLHVGFAGTVAARAHAVAGRHPEGGGTTPAAAGAAGSSHTTVTFDVSGGAVSFEVFGGATLSGHGCVDVTLHRSDGVRVFEADFCADEPGRISASGSLVPGEYTFGVFVAASAVQRSDYDLDARLVTEGIATSNADLGVSLLLSP